MTPLRVFTLLLSAAACTSACGQSSEASAAQKQTVLAQREALFEQRVAAADSNPQDDKPVAMWMMPAELREISGLALTADGRLLAHNDELGRVFILDPRRGVILKRFTLSGVPRVDFEGITVVGGSIYLLQSNGSLYEFAEGKDNATVPYRLHDTHLGKECEFEAVTYQPDSAWLVMPCKNVGEKGKREDELVIYRLKLRDPTPSGLTMMRIPMDKVVGSNGWKSLHPSDAAIDPATGNLVLVASQEKALVVISPSGEVLQSEELPKGHHQAEGVAITRDGFLIVSDEAAKEPAKITLYRWRGRI